jgi:hypothetical protein
LIVSKKGVGMLNAEEIVNREYLELRSLMLKIASAFDRIERAGGDLAENPKTQLLSKALGILTDGQPGRAERIQLLCSRPYDEHWMTKRSR